MEHSLKKTEPKTLAQVLSSKPSCEALGSKNLQCEAHGQYLSAGTRYLGKREIWTPCPDCEEARLTAELQAQAQAAAKAAQSRIEAAIGQAAIPQRFIGRSFDNFHADTPRLLAALQAAQDFARDFEAKSKQGATLILSGLPGTGKSHLAIAVLQEIMPEHVGLYTTCMGVIRAVRGTWRKDSEQSEAQVLDTFGTVPLLVLDEIGVQYGTDGEQTILFDVLDRRYRDMKPTILLTNQDRAGFKQFIGERTYDRLTEISRWVSFDWGSYRPKARELAHG